MTHYYSKKQTSSINLKKIKIQLKNREFELYSASGIFSKDKLDKGTKLLIENCVIEPNWNVLDFGCGIGVIGIAVKLIYPTTKVLITDINQRAVMISKKNVRLHNLEIQVIKCDLYSKIKDKFNTILVNPPQTAGKEICFQIIDNAKNHLKERGLLQLVARHNKGGSVLEKRMNQVFGNVEQVAKGSGYRIYVSEN